MYASSLTDAAKDDPDELGSIAEKEVLVGNFPIPRKERIADKEQEKLLLIALVEDLLRYEVVLREQSDDGAHLIFPSQSTREDPNLFNLGRNAMIFSFEGAVLNIYATLAVRLSHSGLFKRQKHGKNIITYTTKLGGTYGIFLEDHGEGQAELILFFDEATHEETRFYFEDYVYAHLKRRALTESLQLKRIFSCRECGFLVPDQLVRIRNQRGFNWLDCPGCGNNRILLPDWKEKLTMSSSMHLIEMDHTADHERDREASLSAVQGKIATGDFDVFLCHNGNDKPEVKKIGEKLRERGLLPWLDEWELQPGMPWQRQLEQQIQRIKAVAVFVGESGVGPWQQIELEAFLREFVKRGSPVIPVLLPQTCQQPHIPVFLNAMTWVDFRKQNPNPMEQLIWGITGDHNSYP